MHAHKAGAAQAGAATAAGAMALGAVGAMAHGAMEQPHAATVHGEAGVIVPMVQTAHHTAAMAAVRAPAATAAVHTATMAVAILHQRAHAQFQQPALAAAMAIA